MNEPKVAQWFVGFSSEGTPKWNIFLKKGFAHCYAMSLQYPFGYIAIDPNAPFTEVHHGEPEKGTVYDTIAKLKQANHKILFVSNPINQNRCIRYIEFCSCVTIIKQLLGFHSMAQTPYQLYKALKKIGATEL